ncbi:TetR/AcrR family transcriptional regulator [Nocardia vinacea]|uniref:TetR/AcrR family transcriptional regulator n=1 Tax=Nocardia vinacea TaxID=96468 RepID=UPI002E104EB3|nr:TetR/AcrR family transcriptional regulator [Nocardia vinacea]
MARVDRNLPTPKQARSELSTSRLLDAAADLIAEGGYERMTLAAIGVRAGYSPGLVTARFGSKEGLLWALVERMVVDWQGRSLREVIGGTTGAVAIRAMLAELKSSWLRSPNRMRALYILMFEALLPVPLLQQRMLELHRDLRTSVRGVIESGMAEGTVGSDVDAEAVARLVVGGLRGAAYQAMLDPEDVAVDRALDDLGLLIDALLPVGVDHGAEKIG